MLAVDLLHEFELGVWKAIFMHLVRLLYSATPAGRLVTELDRRYVFKFAVDLRLTGCLLGFVLCQLLVAARSVDSQQTPLK